MNEQDDLEWDDRSEDKGVENKHFSRPSSEIIAYAQANQLHFNLWSKVAQRIIKLRMLHPEWKEEQNKTHQELLMLIDQPIILILQMLFVGKVQAVGEKTLTLAIADQSQEAVDWLRSVLSQRQEPGLYKLPANFPFTLTYENSHAHKVGSWQFLELIQLPGYGEVKVLEEA
jgi:hypothetical protein